MFALYIKMQMKSVDVIKIINSNIVYDINRLGLNLEFMYASKLEIIYKINETVIQ